MLSLDPSDYMLMEHFPMKWRWTDPKHTLLPFKLLQRIKPIEAAKSNELWQKSQPILRTNETSNSTKDSLAKTLEFRTDLVDKKSTIQWLKTNTADLSEEILVNWDSETAVLTDTHYFVSIGIAFAILPPTMCAYYHWIANGYFNIGTMSNLILYILTHKKPKICFRSHIQ